MSPEQVRYLNREKQICFMVTAGMCFCIFPCGFLFYLVGCAAAGQCPWKDEAGQAVIIASVTLICLGLLLFCCALHLEESQFELQFWKARPESSAAVRESSLPC